MNTSFFLQPLSFNLVLTLPAIIKYLRLSGLSRHLFLQDEGSVPGEDFLSCVAHGELITMSSHGLFGSPGRRKSSPLFLCKAANPTKSGLLCCSVFDNLTQTRAPEEEGNLSRGIVPSCSTSVGGGRGTTVFYCLIIAVGGLYCGQCYLWVGGSGLYKKAA